MLMKLQATIESRRSEAADAIDEKLSMDIEYLTDIIILLAAAVIAVPLFPSWRPGAISVFW